MQQPVCRPCSTGRSNILLSFVLFGSSATIEAEKSSGSKRGGTGMSDSMWLQLVLFLGFAILSGLLYLLLTSYRSRKKDVPGDTDDDTKAPDDDNDDPEWRAKRFWWFGR